MSFAHPAWFIALLLLPIIGIAAILVAHSRHQQWAALVSTRLRSSLIKHSSSLPRWIAFTFLIAATAIIIAALARPQGDSGTRNEKTMGRNILFALDLSRSMRTQDVKPDRLSQAKTTIYELMEAMPNERIGLIGFAGSSYLYAPLTIDHQAVKETVEQIDETWATVGGSNLSSSVELAIDTLKGTGQKNNALIILSDGEKHDGSLDDIIKEAKHSGVCIITIGVGTEDGDYVPNPESSDNRMLDKNRKPVLSRLQPKTLQQLANETNGTYTNAGVGIDIPSLVKSTVSHLDAFEMEGREQKIAVEFFQWLTFPAILFLMASIIAGTRWRGVSSALLLSLMVLIPTQTHANESDDAIRSFANSKNTVSFYQKILKSTISTKQQARQNLKDAYSAYQAGDFKTAREAYSQSLLSAESTVLHAGHHGIGNTLFQIGWKSLGSNSYTNPSSTPQNLESFDSMVRDKLKSLLESEQENPYNEIKSVITNWTDAVRHYDSALKINTSDSAVTHNRALTMTYLNRLAELLKEEEEQSEQSMPQPQPDPNKPDDKGKKDPKKDPNGNKDPKNQNPKNPNGDNKDPKDLKNPGDKPDQDPTDDPSGKKPKDPSQTKESQPSNESPEKKARRILKENGDLEKGPLSPAFREFLDPEKDW